jgi:hypothetical protein
MSCQSGLKTVELVSQINEREVRYKINECV